MSTTISRSIDVEEAVREVLKEHMTVYCPPLPESFDVPCILAQMTGGDTEASISGKGQIDTFIVTLDSRANEEAEALEALRNAADESPPPVPSVPSVFAPSMPNLCPHVKHSDTIRILLHRHGC